MVTIRQMQMCNSTENSALQLVNHYRMLVATFKFKWVPKFTPKFQSKIYFIAAITLSMHFIPIVHLVRIFYSTKSLARQMPLLELKVTKRQTI